MIARLFLFAFLASLLVARCSGRPVEIDGIDLGDGTFNFPLSKVEKDNRSAFRIDPAQPWRIEFGRGSGYHGLQTIKLDQDGQLVLHRLNWPVERWQITTLTLPPDGVAKVLEAVESHRLLELDKAYHANVHDGTQWVLWIQQGEREKAVYFDNHFPEPIIRFARQMDEMLSALGSVEWHWVPAAEPRKHERELWDSIKR